MNRIRSFRHPFLVLLTVVLPAGLHGLTINFDINAGTTGHYAGPGLAPDEGTVWNAGAIPGTQANFYLLAVTDSRGTVVPDGIIYIEETGSQKVTASRETTLGNPDPLLLMQDYLSGGTYRVVVAGLEEGQYGLYVFAHGEQSGQSGSVTLDADNGGASGSTGTGGDQYRNLYADGSEGTAYLSFNGVTVPQDGLLTFTVENYLNGFQVIKEEVPVILTQPPAELTGYSGLSQSISVQAEDTAGLAFQWQKSIDGGINYTDIDIASNPSAGTETLVLEDLDYDDSGHYRVVLSTPFGSETSTATELTVIANPTPLFSRQPVDQSGGYGEPVVFSALAVADAGVNYQWYWNDQPIAGATEATYTIQELRLDDAGVYHVVASNVYGSTESEPATLIIRLPAFPGADGPGGEATGGRGGDVYHVTNLDDDINNPPPGSLRAALKNIPPGGRTVVFDVSGLVYLDPADGTQGWLKTSADNLTIAGQTAPYPGITVAGQGSKFSGANNVLRHLKIRPGKHQVDPGISTHDAISNYLQHSIIDHMSVSWADDELLSSTDLVDSSTVQYCLIGEGLYYDLEGGKTHAYGALINSEVPNAPVSYHHNLFAHVQSRLPRIQAEIPPGLVLNWSNNVIYNWSGNAGYSGVGEPTRMNFIGNYYIAGFNTRTTDRAFYSPDTATRIYYENNYRDRDKDGQLDGSDPGAAQFIEGGGFTHETSPFTEVDIPLLDEPSHLVQSVISRAGAFWWDRDAVDTRIIQDTLNLTGQFITEPSAVGGWDQRSNSRPAVFDSDGDGMSNAWEEAHGLNPLLFNPHSDINRDGYSNLQNYLIDLGAFPLLEEATFEPGSGRYADPTAWSRWWIPSRFDTVVIGNAGVSIDSPGNWAGTVRLEPDNGESAVVSISQGWWLVAGNLLPGPEGTVSLEQSGGLVRVDGTLGLASPGGTASYNLDDGVLYANSIEIGPGGSLSLTGGILHARTILAGSVLLDGTRLAPGTSPGAEAPQAALSDRAPVPATGSTVGTTAFSGDLDLGGGVLEIGIEGPATADRITVAGNLSLGGTLKVTRPNGYQPLPGSTYVIAEAGSLGGSFSSIPSQYEISTNASGQVILTYVGNIFSYDDWAGALPFPSPSARLPGADPDGDGWSNELEFGFDGDPLEPDQPRGFPGLETAGQGTFVLDPDTPLIRFAHRQSSDLAYIVEVSDNLVDWSEIWSTDDGWEDEAVLSRSEGLYFDELVIQAGTGGSSPLFARIRLDLATELLLVAPMGLTGAEDLPPDVAPSLVFNRPIRAGSPGTIRLYREDGTLVNSIDLAGNPTRSIGDAEFNYYPILIRDNTVQLVFDREDLQYGESYYVQVAAGVIEDLEGTPWPGISDDQTMRFNIRATGPAGNATPLMVNSDGSGDFCTVQGAIEHISNGLGERVTIEVADGWYEEIVYIISQKGPITIRGESRFGTVLAYANNANFNSSRASFRNRADGLTVEDLTLINTTPNGGSQAEAFMSQANRVVVRNCDISSYQDTVRIDKSAYLSDCYIEGDVDYFWGDGVAYMDNCHLHTLENGYVVQARNEGANHGFIFRECLITGEPEAAGTYLARIDPNVYPTSEVVFLNCAMDDSIHPQGWLLNGASSAPEVRFHEYQSIGLDGQPVDTSQRLPDSTQLTPAEAAPFLDIPALLGFDPATR